MSQDMPRVRSPDSPPGGTQALPTSSHTSRRRTWQPIPDRQPPGRLIEQLPKLVRVDIHQRTLDVVHARIIKEELPLGAVLRDVLVVRPLHALAEMRHRDWVLYHLEKIWIVLAFECQY